MILLSNKEINVGYISYIKRIETTLDDTMCSSEDISYHFLNQNDYLKKKKEIKGNFESIIKNKKIS